MITMHARLRETDRPTDGRTDGQTMAIARRFVLTNASRAKKSMSTCAYTKLSFE